MSIGNRIKDRRKFLKMSVDDLAEEIGKNRTTVYRYENGNIENLPTSILEPLAIALKTTPEYLIGWEDDPVDYEQLLDEMGESIPYDFCSDELDSRERAKKWLNFNKECKKDYYDDFEDVLSDNEESNPHNSKVKSVKEDNLLKKYRSLDTLDQRAVDGLLDTLSERVNIKEQPLETEHATLIHEDRLYMTFYDYGTSAGTGNYLDEWDIPKSTISVPDNPETRKADFVLRVCGESMEPDYHDGDRVLVKSQDSVNLNDIAIYIIDGESYIKQYKGGYLHSLNPSYGDIQMNEGQAIKCVGKVIGKL